MLAPTEAESAMRAAAIARITEVVTAIWPSAEVQVFGSFVTGARVLSPTLQIARVRVRACMHACMHMRVSLSGVYVRAQALVSGSLCRDACVHMPLTGRMCAFMCACARARVCACVCGWVCVCARALECWCLAAVISRAL